MRQIIFSKSFDEAVEEVGGYRLVDEVLELVIDGLRLNPYGFEHFETDKSEFSFRYLVVDPPNGIRPLLFIFRILENKDVELTHIEYLEQY